MIEAVCSKEDFVAEKKLSEKLKFCLETDHCADGDCPYYECDSVMTCKGLLQNAYERIREIEEFEEIFHSKMTDTICNLLSDKEEFAKWLDRNKWIAKKCDKYARAEEQGKLLKLPCVVGTPVYMIAQDCGGDTLNCRSRDCENCEYLYSFVEENKFETYMCDEIGKTVFLTKSAAEQALKELEVVK